MTDVLAPRGDADGELVSLGHENLIEAFRRVARALPGSRILEEPDAVYVASGLSVATYNPVFIRPGCVEPRRVLAQASEFMERARVSRWRIVPLPGVSPDVSISVKAAGLSPGLKLPGMLLSPVPTILDPLPAELRIEPTRDRSSWDRMVRVGATGFGGPPPDDVDAVFPFDRHRPERGYLASWGGKPAGSAIAIDHLGIAGIYYVATLPEFRGKGIGSALTMRAAVDGPGAGSRASFLQSSEMGFRVYLRLGFRHLVTYDEWVKGPSVPDERQRT